MIALADSIYFPFLKKVLTSKHMSVGSSGRLFCLMRFACRAISSMLGLVTGGKGILSLISIIALSTMPIAGQNMFFTATSLACKKRRQFQNQPLVCWTCG